jgi:hypothetical protein
MRPSPRLATFAAATVAAFMLMTAPALAKPIPVETELIAKAKLLSATEARYSGTLITDPKKPLHKDAPKEAKKRVRKAVNECLDGRVVSVFHEGFLIARTLTDEDGSWSVRGPVPPAGEPVDVVVSKRKTGRAACTPDSKRIPVLSKVV